MAVALTSKISCVKIIPLSVTVEGLTQNILSDVLLQLRHRACSQSARARNFGAHFCALRTAAQLFRIFRRRARVMASREDGPGSRHSLAGQDSEAAIHRHHRKGHRRSIMHANVAESMKMKQVRMKIRIYSSCLFYILYLAGAY